MNLHLADNAAGKLRASAAMQNLEKNRNLKKIVIKNVRWWSLFIKFQSSRIFSRIKSGTDIVMIFWRDMQFCPALRQTDATSSKVRFSKLKNTLKIKMYRKNYFWGLACANHVTRLTCEVATVSAIIKKKWSGVLPFCTNYIESYSNGTSLEILWIDFTRELRDDMKIHSHISSTYWLNVRAAI